MVKVALITGGSRGIGRAIAKRLCGRYKIATFDILSPEEPLKDEIFINVDITSSHEVKEGVERIIKEAGRIDVLVNNAGITKDVLLLRMSDEDWDRVLNINLKGAFLCSREVSKVMVKQRQGKIINISSIIGLMGNIGQSNYASSKGGLISLTKSLAKELALRNITVNAIAPGFIETKMTLKLKDEIRNEICERIPLKRFGKPEDIASLVEFLTQDDASYITGQVITIDGGLSIAL